MSIIKNKQKYEREAIQRVRKLITALLSTIRNTLLKRSKYEVIQQIRTNQSERKCVLSGMYY